MSGDDRGRNLGYSLLISTGSAATAASAWVNPGRFTIGFAVMSFLMALTSIGITVVRLAIYESGASR